MCRRCCVRSRKLLVGLCVLAEVSLLCSMSVAADLNSTIKIGVILPLSGSLSQCSDFQAGLDVAHSLVDQVNQSGGIAGRQLRLKITDSESNPEIARKRFFELVNTHGVVAVLGGITPAISSALEAEAALRDTLLMTLTAPCNSSSKVGSRYSLSIASSRVDEVWALAGAVQQCGYTIATIITDEDASSEMALAELADALESLGISIQGVVHYDPRQSDHSDLVEGVRSSAGIIIPLLYGDSGWQAVDNLLASGVEGPMALWPYVMNGQFFAVLGRHSFSQEILGVQTTATLSTRLVDAVVLLLAGLKCAGDMEPETLSRMISGIASPPGRAFFPTFSDGWGMEGKAPSELDYIGLSGDVGARGDGHSLLYSWRLQNEDIQLLNITGDTAEETSLQYKLAGIGLGCLPPGMEEDTPSLWEKTKDAMTTLWEGASITIDELKAKWGKKPSVEEVCSVIRWVSLKLLNLSVTVCVAPVLGSLAPYAGDAAEELGVRLGTFVEKLWDASMDYTIAEGSFLDRLLAKDIPRESPRAVLDDLFEAAKLANEILTSEYYEE